MYEPPTIYTGVESVTGDQMIASGQSAAMLAKMQSAALHKVIEAANAAGDYLDPNSITVEVRVEARAL